MVSGKLLVFAGGLGLMWRSCTGQARALLTGYRGRLAGTRPGPCWTTADRICDTQAESESAREGDREV